MPYPPQQLRLFDASNAVFDSLEDIQIVGTGGTTVTIAKLSGGTRRGRVTIDGAGAGVTKVARGATVLNPTSGQTIMVWRAPFACTVTNVRAHFKGGTSIVYNAQRNQASKHLASDQTDATADVWVDGGAVQNTAYAAGDDLEIMLVTITGVVTEAAIQVDLSVP